MVIADVQLVRKAVLAAAVVAGIFLFAFTTSLAPSGQPLHEAIEWVGIVLMVMTILGRTWCTLYIGGRKGHQLITEGPYSVSRNPLYVFSILGAAGIGAQLGSVLVAIAFGAVAWLVFYVVVRQEEQLLSGVYGETYAGYVATVPRFFPNPRLWRDVSSLNVMPPKMVRTFADAMLFLLAVPVAELFERLQEGGVLPIVAHLP